MDMEPKDYIAGITALAQVGIAYLVFRFTRQQQSESWLREFTQIHREFWTADVMKEVRSWIACSAAFANGPQSALEKRKAVHEKQAPKSELTAEQYESLEKIDHFLNLLIRILAVNHEIGDRRAQGLWNDLYLDYWAKEYMKSQPLFSWYAREFYPSHAKLFENPGVSTSYFRAAKQEPN